MKHGKKRVREAVGIWTKRLLADKEVHLHAIEDCPYGAALDSLGLSARQMAKALRIAMTKLMNQGYVIRRDGDDLQAVRLDDVPPADREALLRQRATRQQPPVWRSKKTSVYYVPSEEAPVMTTADLRKLADTAYAGVICARCGSHTKMPWQEFADRAVRSTGPVRVQWNCECGGNENDVSVYMLTEEELREFREHGEQEARS